RVETSVNRRKRILLSVAAGILAILVNQFPVPVFTGALFRFGSALYLSAGILFGARYGLLAGGIVGLSGIVTWKQIWFILLFPVEGFVVPWATRRHSIPPVVATFIFRLCAVLPWAATVYRLGLAASNSAPRV